MANLLTAKDLAEKLSISQRKAYSLKSVIGHVQIEGNVRFEASAVEAYIESCKHSPLKKGKDGWESQSGTALPATAGLSRKQVSAADISALLEQKRKEKRESESARTLRVD
tara:strand:+ start:802 stop:1134 length:333 start_codon:yes stop_codon:yes gene_type:complete